MLGFVLIVEGEEDCDEMIELTEIKSERKIAERILREFMFFLSQRRERETVAGIESKGGEIERIRGYFKGYGSMWGQRVEDRVHVRKYVT